RLVAAAHANLHRELAALADGVQLGRRMDVAVVIRRSLHDLPVLVAVAARNLDQSRSLEHEVTLRSVGPEAIGRAAGDDDVVPFLVRELAKDRLERPGSLVDEDDLVALAVSEEVLHRPARAAKRDLEVIVPHEQAA